MVRSWRWWRPSFCADISTQSTHRHSPDCMSRYSAMWRSRACAPWSCWWSGASPAWAMDSCQALRNGRSACVISATSLSPAFRWPGPRGWCTWVPACPCGRSRLPLWACSGWWRCRRSSSFAGCCNSGWSSGRAAPRGRWPARRFCSAGCTSGFADSPTGDSRSPRRGPAGYHHGSTRRRPLGVGVGRRVDSVRRGAPRVSRIPQLEIRAGRGGGRLVLRPGLPADAEHPRQHGDTRAGGYAMAGVVCVKEGRLIAGKSFSRAARSLRANHTLLGPERHADNGCCVAVEQEKVLVSLGPYEAFAAPDGFCMGVTGKVTEGIGPLAICVALLKSCHDWLDDELGLNDAAAAIAALPSR